MGGPHTVGIGDPVTNSFSYIKFTLEDPKLKVFVNFNAVTAKTINLANTNNLIKSILKRTQTPKESIENTRFTYNMNIIAELIEIQKNRFKWQLTRLKLE